jgi:hypothetical protein
VDENQNLLLSRRKVHRLQVSEVKAISRMCQPKNDKLGLNEQLSYFITRRLCRLPLIVAEDNRKRVEWYTRPCRNLSRGEMSTSKTDKEMEV